MGLCRSPKYHNFTKNSTKILSAELRLLLISKHVLFLTCLVQIAGLWGRAGAPNITMSTRSLQIYEVRSRDLCRCPNLDFSWHVPSGSPGHGIVPEAQTSQFQQHIYEIMEIEVEISADLQTRSVLDLARADRVLTVRGAEHQISSFQLHIYKIWGSSINFSWHVLCGLLGHGSCRSPTYIKIIIWTTHL